MKSRSRMGRAARRSILRTGRQLGLEPQLRSVQRTFERGEQRQTRLDDDHVGLLCANTLRIDSNCIDVGANVGRILEHFVRVAPLGRHIAFEPLPELAADLERRFANVQVRQVALGRTPQSDREFVRVLDAPSRSGFKPAVAGDCETSNLVVAVESLDQTLSAADYVPALLKVDVEGAELEVLEGALNTLKTHRPILLLEHQVSGTSASDVLYDLLVEEVGFSLFDMGGTGPYSRDDFLRTVLTRQRWNFVARSYV
jgi:FkbM family methyltransferase